MALENRNLEAGTRLVARYKGQTYSAEVVQTEEGLRYRLEDGRDFKSPSAAGSAVMGGVACNGWRFWSLAGEAPATPKKERKAPAPKAAPKPRKPAPKTQGFHRLPDEEGADEGTAKFFCDACMEAFEAPAGDEPAACPKGHQPDGSPAESAV